MLGGSTIPDRLRTPSSCISIYSAIEEPCRIMSSALEQALSLLEGTVAHAFDVPRSRSSSPDGNLDGDKLLASYPKAQGDVARAVKLLKVQLGTIHNSLERRTRSSPHGAEIDDVSKEVFAISLFAVSLLQVRDKRTQQGSTYECPPITSITQLAADLNTALRIGKRIITKLLTRKRRRIWFPKLTRSWFTSHTHTMSYEAGDFNIEQFGMSKYLCSISHPLIEPESRASLQQVILLTNQLLPSNARGSLKRRKS